MPEIDLDHFVQAQDQVIDQVHRELRAGRKQSHWMWFVFPQLVGLGRSSTARYYAIASLDEARTYLKHAVLGPRLIECTELVNDITNRSVLEIFGTPDDLKFHSCMTLFATAEPTAGAFQNALAKYFGRARDRLTVKLLGPTPEIKQ